MLNQLKIDIMAYLRLDSCFELKFETYLIDPKYAIVSTLGVCHPWFMI